MRRLTSRRPAPGTVIALIALFVALGGTGYAAFKLPKNSVGNKQLKNNAVTGSKVKDGSLTGKDIKASSLGVVPAAANATNAANALHAASADAATNATSAGSAANAANADKLGGKDPSSFASSDALGGVQLRKWFHVFAASSDTAVVLDFDGLKLTATCGSGATNTLVATTSVDHAAYNLDGEYAGTTAGGATDFNFTTSDSVDLMQGHGYGQFTFNYARPDGVVVSLNGQMDYGGSFFGSVNGQCYTSGTAIGG